MFYEAVRQASGKAEQSRIDEDRRAVQSRK